MSFNDLMLLLVGIGTIIFIVAMGGRVRASVSADKERYRFYNKLVIASLMVALLGLVGLLTAYFYF